MQAFFLTTLAPQYASPLLSPLLFSLAGKIFGAEGMGAFSTFRYQIILRLPVIEITGSGFPSSCSAGSQVERGEGAIDCPTARHVADGCIGQEGI